MRRVIEEEPYGMALDINNTTTCTCTHTRKSHFISDQEEPIPAQIYTVGICIREGESKRVGVYTLAIIIVIIYEHDAGVNVTTRAHGTPPPFSQ